jgi:hypothetical protein
MAVRQGTGLASGHLQKNRADSYEELSSPNATQMGRKKNHKLGSDLGCLNKQPDDVARNSLLHY